MQVAAKQQEEEAAKIRAEQAKETRAKLAQDQQAITNQMFAGTRADAAKARTAAWKEKKDEEARVAMELKKVADDAKS